MCGPGLTPSSIRCRPSTSGAGGACSTPSARARSRNQSIARAIERACPAVAVGVREPRQQLEIDFQREPSKRAVARPASATFETRSASGDARRGRARRGARRSRRASARSVDRAAPSPARRRLPRVPAIGSGRRSTAVVAGLPRSWQTAPSIIATARPRSRSSIRRRASSTTISVCTQTSPSGCHSGSCGQPTSASSSGHSRWTTPRSSASAKPIDGRARLKQQLLDLAPHAFGRQIVERNRPAQRARVRHRRSARTARRTGARAARAGCRRQTCPDRRRGGDAPRDPRGRRKGSRISPVSGSREIALIVKSRRRAASSIDSAGSPVDGESLVPAAGLRLAARERDVEIADLVDGEALADRLDVAESLRAAREVDPPGGRRPRDRDPWAAAEQLVAHPAADDERAAAGGADRARDREREVRRRSRHRPSPAARRAA